MKALIIGPRYFNFLSATRYAFEQNGYEPVVLAYDVPVHPYTAAMKVRYKLSRRKAELRRKGSEQFSRQAVEAFLKIRPSIVFIENGEALTTAALRTFRQYGAKVVLWIFDNRERLPRTEELAREADRLLCFERRDAEWFSALGINTGFLPQACDTQTYRPLGLEKDIDILFVGNLYGSEKRKSTMLSVIEAFPDRKIEVYGLYQPWYKGIWKWIARPRKDIFKNRNVEPAKVNELYNRAKVVLNIHQELQSDGANPRVFEICGAGAYQICDRNEYIGSLFPDGSIGLYTGEGELCSLIREALSSPDEAALKAEKARQTVLERHTFKERISTIGE